MNRWRDFPQRWREQYARTGQVPNWHFAVRRGDRLVMECVHLLTRAELDAVKVSYEAVNYDYQQFVLACERNRRGPPHGPSLCYNAKEGWIPCSALSTAT